MMSGNNSCWLATTSLAPTCAQQPALTCFRASQAACTEGLIHRAGLLDSSLVGCDVFLAEG